jgi:parallel beta-helix repeat protein
LIERQFLALGYALAIALVITGPAGAATINVGYDCSYKSIQEAIDAATPGDTLLIHNGVYRENVRVHKRLALKGMGKTVIDACGTGTALTVYGNGSRIEDLAETNSCPWPQAGLMVMSENVTILNNSVRGCLYGISLLKSRNVTIKDCEAENNLVGICLVACEDSIVRDSKACNNSIFGIVYLASEGNTIADNTARGNYIGIRLWSCINNSICRNTARDNNRAGIYLSRSRHNILFHNLLVDNREFDAFDAGTDLWDNRTISNYRSISPNSHSPEEGRLVKDRLVKDSLKNGSGPDNKGFVSKGIVSVSEGKGISESIKWWYQGRNEVIF